MLREASSEAREVGILEDEEVRVAFLTWKAVKGEALSRAKVKDKY